MALADWWQEEEEGVQGFKKADDSVLATRKCVYRKQMACRCRILTFDKNSWPTQALVGGCILLPCWWCRNDMASCTYDLE